MIWDITFIECVSYQIVIKLVQVLKLALKYFIKENNKFLKFKYSFN